MPLRTPLLSEGAQGDKEFNVKVHYNMKRKICGQLFKLTPTKTKNKRSYEEARYSTTRPHDHIRHTHPELRCSLLQIAKPSCWALFLRKRECDAVISPHHTAGLSI